VPGAIIFTSISYVRQRGEDEVIQTEENTADTLDQRESAPPVSRQDDDNAPRSGTDELKLLGMPQGVKEKTMLRFFRWGSRRNGETVPSLASFLHFTEKALRPLEGEGTHILPPPFSSLQPEVGDEQLPFQCPRQLMKPMIHPHSF
jgi:hypothetical protein